MKSLDLALSLASKGFSVFPVHGITEAGACTCEKITCDPKHKGKHPWTRHGFKDATTNPETIRHLFQRKPNANVGLATYDLAVVDIDPRNGGSVEAVFGDTVPETPTTDTGGGGVHFIFRAPEGVKLPSVLTTGVDIKSGGPYIVAPGSLHASGKRYVWRPGRSIDDVALAPFPLTILGLLSNVNRVSAAKHITRGTAVARSYYAQRALESEIAAVATSPSHAGNDQLNESAFNLGQLVGGGELDEHEVRVALLQAAVPRRPESEARATISSGLTAGMKQPRRAPEQHRRRRHAYGLTEVTLESTGELVPYAGTEPNSTIKRARYLRADSGNAELFADMHGETLRYDHLRGKWIGWRGHYWKIDEDGHVWRLAKATARELFKIASEIGDREEREAETAWALKTMNRDRLTSMLKLAENEHPITDSGHQWDLDPYLLGTPNGVVDLRTGLSRAGKQSDRITAITGVPFDPDATCPAWEEFLSQVFGNEDIIDFMWRAVGYSLTGEVREHHFFILYGKGSNGKSTFLEILRFVLGNYAANTPFSTLESQKNSGSIPNDLAALLGRRFVTSVETADGARFNEPRVKALTGGDITTARFLFREFFDFYPVLKLWLATNHKPRVRDDTEGFWRRPLLIGFERTFERGKTADDSLIDKLKAEGAGILAWAVRGCLEWQRTKLNPPAAITSATQAYRQESDPLGEFYPEVCEVKRERKVGAAELYDAYLAWAKKRRIPEKEQMTTTTFGKLIVQRFERKSTSKGRVYLGVGLQGVPDLPLDE
jgi:putative DNA primase/helicase